MLRKGLQMRMTGKTKYSDCYPKILRPVIGDRGQRQRHSGSSVRQTTDESNGRYCELAQQAA